MNIIQQLFSGLYKIVKHFINSKHISYNFFAGSGIKLISLFYECPILHMYRCVCVCGAGWVLGRVQPYWWHQSACSLLDGAVRCNWLHCPQMDWGPQHTGPRSATLTIQSITTHSLQEPRLPFPRLPALRSCSTIFHPIFNFSCHFWFLF